MSLQDQAAISRPRTIRAENVLVLYRATDPVGYSIASYYQQRRQIPGNNLVRVPTEIFPQWSFDPNAADFNQATILNYADAAGTKISVQAFTTWLCSNHLSVKKIKAIVTCGEWPLGWYTPDTWLLNGHSKTALSLSEILAYPFYFKDNWPASLNWNTFGPLFGATDGGMDRMIGSNVDSAYSQGLGSALSPALAQDPTAIITPTIATYPVDHYNLINAIPTDTPFGVRYLHCRLECGRTNPDGESGETRVRRMIDDAIAVEGEWSTLLPAGIGGYGINTYKPASYGLAELRGFYGSVFGNGLYWNLINGEGGPSIAPVMRIPSGNQDFYAYINTTWTIPSDLFRVLMVNSNSGSMQMDNSRYHLARGAIGIMHPSFGGSPVMSVSASVEQSKISIVKADQIASVQSGTADVFGTTKEILFRTEGISPAHKAKIFFQYSGAGSTSVLSCPADGVVEWRVDGVLQKTIRPISIAWKELVRSYFQSAGINYSGGDFQFSLPGDNNIFHTSLVGWFLRAGGCVGIGSGQEPTAGAGTVSDGLFSCLVYGLALGDWFNHANWPISPVDVYGDPLYRPFAGALAPMRRTVGYVRKPGESGPEFANVP